LYIKQNLHTHTTYADGRDTPEELIREAIARGFDSLGFSEHARVPYSSYPSQLTKEKAVRYQNEIGELKKTWEGRISLFCGLEDDFYADTELNGYDYLIGSVHYLDCGGRVATFDCGLEETGRYIDEYFGGDGLAYAKRYFETVASLPEKASYDILGHFDLIVKNNERGNFIDVTSKEYLTLGLEAIHALKGRIPFFEVNTGAIARGYRTLPYPQAELCRELLTCGFGAVITSDCHDGRYLDCCFEEAREFLAAQGFSSRWVLTENGFVEVGL
jgi:histidinol-phosphatase (PHP family)